MSRYRLIELCAGSAALTFHLLGERATLPYQGSKWRLRAPLARALKLDPAAMESAYLTDPGPWGTVLGAILSPTRRRRVLRELRALNDLDPRLAYDRLQGSAPATRQCTFAAEYLFLQRLAFSGKAVAVKAGVWASPGFNRSSAYGLAGTAKFGQVRPQVASLIERLAGMAPAYRATVRVGHRRAHRPTAGYMGTAPRTVVYIDPPYSGTTGYPDVLERSEVAYLARAWALAGAEVYVSEATPVGELTALGWGSMLLNPGKTGDAPFHGRQAEWVTYSPGAPL